MQSRKVIEASERSGADPRPFALRRLAAARPNITAAVTAR
jgi:hypothetical protein